MYVGLRKTLLAWVIFAAIIAGILLIPGASAPIFGSIDLLQYWAGAKLFLADANPYDPQAMLQIERPFEMPGVTLPVLLWNPPLVFPFILFLAPLPFPAAVYLWGTLSVMLLAASVMLLREAFDLDGKRERIIFALLLVVFYPFALSLFYGQITPLLLTGLSGFFFYVKRDCSVTRSTRAGLALSLTLLKPHLLYLIYLYLFVRSLKEKRWKTLIGLAAGAALMILISMSLNPAILTHYARFIAKPPIEWQTPTLGSHLQALFPAYGHFARLLPSLVSASVLPAFAITKRTSATFVLILLLPISLVTSPYGWVYDQMLLFPLAAACVAQLRLSIHSAKLAVGVLFMANLLVVFAPEGQQWMVWYPLLFLFAAWKALQEGD